MTEIVDDEPLGSLEAELLHILWNSGDWLSAPVLHERLTLGRPLAYTTVSTVLIRLWNKGHLERVREGRSFATRAHRNEVPDDTSQPPRAYWTTPLAVSVP